jgi:stage V sporulation protein B
MAWTSGDNDSIKSNIQSMLKVITLISFPMGIGVIALAPQIVALLYSAEDAIISVNLLRILGGAACFAGMTTPLTNMLQAIGKPSAPVKNIAVGAVIKIVFNYILVGIPQINILGAPIGTLLCYMYIAFADIYCLVKYSKTKPSFAVAIFKPLISAIICGAVAFAFNGLVSIYFESRLVTVLAIICAMVAYVISISIFRCIEKDDVLSLPKGEKLLKIFTKIGITKV